MKIRDISDLEPTSTGFASRGAESINIMGNMISDIFEGLGNALSGITGHGSHNRSDRGAILEARRLANVNDPDPDRARADALRVQRNIDENVADIT